MRLSKAASYWLFFVLLPLNAFALSLGEIDLRSNLNEPFDAQIPLDAAATEDLSGLEVTLADPDTFARYGLDRPQFLNGIEFNVAKDETGAAFIHLTSVSSVAEPFVTVLLDVKWASGRLLREYTVLLDPPLYEESIVQTPAITAPVAEPVAESAAEGAVERPVDIQPEPLAEDFSLVEPVPEQAAESTVDLTFEPVAEPPVTEADPLPAEDLGLPEPAAASDPVASDAISTLEPLGPTAGVTPGDYEVQRGDTLWELGDNARGGSGLTINQMMLALYRANPEAFIGNINGLKAGAILRIPGEEEIALISHSEATAEARDQNSAWQVSNGFAALAGREAPRLELVAPSAGEGEAATATTVTTDGAAASGLASQEAVELRSRATQLEAQLTDSERLIEVRDAELAALQARIQELESQAADTAGQSVLEAYSGATETDAALAPSVLELEAGADIEVDAALDQQIESELLDQESAAEDAFVGSETSEIEAVADETNIAPPAPTQSLFDRLINNLWLWVGAIVAVLFVSMLAWRRRQTAMDEDAFGTGDWEVPVLAAGDVEADDLPPLDDSSVVAEGDPIATADFETVAKPDESAVPTEVAASTPDDADAEVPLERTISTGAPMNLDQSDPIAEAEFHMAYGLYDQAADLLTQALATEPGNRAYRVKLIEVYFVWENRDGFLEQARQLQGSLDADGENDWNKVLILGKQLCPDDSLFAGAETTAPSAGAMDLDLPETPESAQTMVDFSLDSSAVGLAVQDAGQPAEDIDFDLGEVDLGLADADLDISLDIDEVTDDPGLDMDFGDELETDMSNSYLALDLTKIEAADVADVAVDDTIESPTVDALGGDAPTIEADMSASTMETPTIESPSLELDVAEDDNAATMETLSGGGDDTSEMLGIDPDELDLSLGDFDLPDADDETVDATLMISDPDAIPLDFSDAESDLSSTQELPDVSADLSSGLTNDMDLVADDTAEQPAIATESATDTAFADDDATPKIPQEVTMTEVGTKLDLARAYIDMGDPDGARSILNEVLVEGSEGQRQEAQQLLGDLED